MQGDSTGKVSSRVLSSRTDAALELRRTSSVQGLALTAAHPSRVLPTTLNPPELGAANTRSGSSQHRQPHRKNVPLNRQNCDQAGVRAAEAGKVLQVTGRRWAGSPSVVAPNLDVQRVRGLSQVVLELSPRLSCCLAGSYRGQLAVHPLCLSSFP